MRPVRYGSLRLVGLFFGIVISVTASLADSGLSRAVDVVAGEGHACTLLADGQVYCWGAILTDLGVSPPLRVDGIPRLDELSVGGVNCGIDTSGRVLCWGAVEKLTDSLRPVAMFSIDGLGFAKAIAVGFAHACAIDRDRQVWCWGSNELGELGTGDTVSSMTPRKALGMSKAIAIGAGVNNSCAIAVDGRVYCWGSDNPTQERPFIFRSMTPMEIPDVKNLVAVQNGRNFACGREHTNRVVCWGSNLMGQLGATIEQSRGPYGIVARGFQELVLDVGTGYFNACAAIADGSVLCWGRWNDEDVYAPTAIDGIVDAERVAVGHDFACALTKAAEIFCWGGNDYGQLGTGEKGYFERPVRLLLRPHD